MLRIQLSRAVCCAVVSSFLISVASAAERLPEAGAAERQAREQVAEALRAEARGDNTSRARGLASAWLSAPELPEANWHLGRVKIDGQWRTLAEAEAAAADDPLRGEYRRLRDEADNARKLLTLARWCAKAGWDDTARLHYAQLLARGDASDAARQEAIKKLDLHNVGGQWITGEELAARQAEAKAIEAALVKWRPKLKKLQEAIDGSDYKQRDKAIAELHQIDDPAVIPVLESFLLDGGERFQEEAVKRLAKFPHYEATEALVKFAVLSNDSLVRDAARKALQERPMHEYVPILLAGLTAPIKSQFQISTDRRGRIGYTHSFLREGPAGNILLASQDVAVHLPTGTVTRTRDVTRVPTWEEETGVTTTSVSGGTTPQQAMLDRLRETAHRAANTQAQVRLANSQIEAANQRTFEALETTTDQQLTREPVQWWTWWQGYNEYSWPRQTRFLRQSSVSTYQSYQWTHHHSQGTVGPRGIGRSCFVAGTPVRTASGLVPIETLQPGDQVLAQDQDTGELTYKTVLRTTLRPPSKIVRIRAGNEEIRTTLGHPFWVSGHGWKMAKELEAGDLLHSLGGAVRVEKVDRLAVPEEAYNLVVDGFNTYFVGQQGLLVHDNEFRKPTRAIVPGLAAE